MAIISFSIEDHFPHGYKDATGHIVFEPSHRHIHRGITLATVRPFTVNYHQDFKIELENTGPDWAWKITINSPRGLIETGYYAITRDEHYVKLRRVDPETLEPDAEPEPIWWEMARSTINSGAVDANGDLILTRNDGGVVNAGRVRGKDGEDGEDGEDGADSNIPGPPGPPNNLTIGAIEFLPGGPGIPGPPGQDGQDGAPGNATMRVDTTVGTRVFITDGTTDELVKADTGWRNVESLLTTGLVKSVSANASAPIMRRENGTVSLEVYLDVMAAGITTILTMPAGFRAKSIISRPGNMYIDTAGVGRPLPSVGLGWYLSSSSVRIAVAIPINTTILLTVSWLTPDSWPTALPGTPA